MSNSILTSDVRIPFIAEVETSLNIVGNGTTQYNKTFVGSNGDTMDILIPSYGNDVGTGADVTSDISDATSGKKQLALTQYHKAVNLTSVEMSLKLGSYVDQVAKPFGQKMASDIQAVAFDVLRKGASSCYVSTSSSYAVIGEAGANIETARSSGELYGIMSPKISKAVIDSGLSLFQADIKSSFLSGKVGAYGGVNFFKSQDAGLPLVIGAQTTNTVAVNQGTAYVAGATTLNIDATGLVGTFKKYQTFTVAGVNMPDVYGKDTGVPYVFTLQADVTASGNALACTIQGVYATGVYKNVTALPADGAVVTFQHAQNTTYHSCLVWDKQAFVTGFAKMRPLATAKGKGSEGKVLNILSQVVSDGLKGLEVIRWDCLAGFMLLYPNMVSRVDIKVA